GGGCLPLPQVDAARVPQAARHLRARRLPVPSKARGRQRHSHESRATVVLLGLDTVAVPAGGSHTPGAHVHPACCLPSGEHGRFRLGGRPHPGRPANRPDLRAVAQTRPPRRRQVRTVMAVRMPTFLTIGTAKSGTRLAPSSATLREILLVTPAML